MKFAAVLTTTATADVSLRMRNEREIKAKNIYAEGNKCFLEALSETQWRRRNLRSC